MDTEKQIKDALVKLARDSMFHTTEAMIYDIKHFSNVIVNLGSDAGINIRCVRDRGYVSCEIGSSEHPGELFDLDDVMAVTGVNARLSGKDVIDTLSSAIDIIERNILQIQEAFSPERYSQTKRRITQIQLQRARDLRRQILHRRTLSRTIRTQLKKLIELLCIKK